MGKRTAKCKFKFPAVGTHCYNVSMTIAKVRTVSGLRARVKTWRKAGLSVGLAPTMGALHAGHLSLVAGLLKKTGRAVVSIYVNPAQFGEGEDFENYPRNEAEDCKMLEAAGAHLVYLPSAAEMYPEGPGASVRVAGLSEVLCGKFRPGHFEGVATVVTKLLLQCQPDAAIFGEKDFQQLQVIQKLAADLDIPVEILGGPTVREADGLAMASRNAYLTAAQRATAAALPKTIKTLLNKAQAGEDLRTLEKEGRAGLLLNGFEAVDYLEFREAGDLSLSRKAGKETRLFAAAWIGKTRLIDNMKVE